MENFRKLSFNWASSSEFVSSSIPSWQILTAHAQPFRGARDLAFCLKVPLDSLLVWASSEGSGETARMRRLAWTFAARIGYKYQIRLTRSNYHETPTLSVYQTDCTTLQAICCILSCGCAMYHSDFKFSYRHVWANSVDPDQTAPLEAVWSGLNYLPLHFLGTLLYGKAILSKF